MTKPRTQVSYEAVWTALRTTSTPIWTRVSVPTVSLRSGDDPGGRARLPRCGFRPGSTGRPSPAWGRSTSSTPSSPTRAFATRTCAPSRVAASKSSSPVERLTDEPRRRFVAFRWTRSPNFKVAIDFGTEMVFVPYNSPGFRRATAMDGFVLLGIIGVVLFFLGPIGFFVALGHGRRIGLLERQVARLAADLASASARTAPPVDWEEHANVGGPAAAPGGSRSGVDRRNRRRAGRSTTARRCGRSPRFPPSAEAPVTPPPPSPEEAAPSPALVAGRTLSTGP